MRTGDLSGRSARGEIRRGRGEEGWDTDFAGVHTLEMTINNSPCKTCAAWLYRWRNRYIFQEFTISFANMYDMKDGFTKATTKLRSGGVLMRPMSVMDKLLPLIDKAYELKARKARRR